MLKSFIKVTLIGFFLAITNVGFTQNSDSKWEIEYITDDFGDWNGECRITQTVFSEKRFEYDIVILKVVIRKPDFEMTIGIKCYDFYDEITDRSASLSFKTTDNKIIKADETVPWRNKVCCF